MIINNKLKANRLVQPRTANTWTRAQAEKLLRAAKVDLSATGSAFKPMAPTENTMTKPDGATILQPFFQKAREESHENSQNSLVFGGFPLARMHTDGMLELVIHQSAVMCLCHSVLHRDGGIWCSEKYVEHDHRKHSDYRLAQRFCNQWFSQNGEG